MLCSLSCYLVNLHVCVLCICICAPPPPPPPSYPFPPLFHVIYCKRLWLLRLGVSIHHHNNNNNNYLDPYVCSYGKMHSLKLGSLPCRVDTLTEWLQTSHGPLITSYNYMMSFYDSRSSVQYRAVRKHSFPWPTDYFLQLHNEFL